MAVSRILDIANAAIEERGSFSLVLAGGKTPELTYTLLAQADADWSKWHLFFGDERCLPVGNDGLNSQMVSCTLTSRVSIPKGQAHPIPVQYGSEEAANRYAQSIKSVTPFDLVLLGIGEDGHTASLFPGYQKPAECVVVSVSDAPKPPKQRVSLSAATLSNSRKILFLVAGAKKNEAVSGWRRGEELPVCWIRPTGFVEVLIDYAAWRNGSEHEKQ